MAILETKIKRPEPSTWSPMCCNGLYSGRTSSGYLKYEKQGARTIYVEHSDCNLSNHFLSKDIIQKKKKN